MCYNKSRDEDKVRRKLPIPVKIPRRRSHTMTKQEFRALTKRDFTDKEYETIETVYTFHPSISETEGKKQIANLFDNFGFRIIADMLPTAVKAREYEGLIAKKRCELEELREAYNELKNPNAAEYAISVEESKIPEIEKYQAAK